MTRLIDNEVVCIIRNKKFNTPVFTKITTLSEIKNIEDQEGFYCEVRQVLNIKGTDNMPILEGSLVEINQNEVGIVKYSFTKKCPSDRTWNVNGIIIDDDSIITTISDGITLTNEWSK